MSKDKVKLYNDERLDIPDADALQTLVYEYLDRAFGSLIGLSQGVAVAEGFLISTNNGALPYEYRLDDCIIYQCTDPGATVTYNTVPQNAGTIGRKGQFVRHDRTINDCLIDFGTLAGGTGSPAFIFAKIGTIETDLDTRRKWDTATGTEIAFSDETRTRQYVSEIRAVAPTMLGANAPEPPDNSGDWCLIGRLTWQADAGGNIALIDPIWAFSYYQTIGSLGLTDAGGDVPVATTKTYMVYKATNTDNRFLAPDTNASSLFPDYALFTDPGFTGDATKQFYPDSVNCVAQYGSQGIAHHLHMLRVQIARMLSYVGDSTSDYVNYPNNLRTLANGTYLETKWYDRPRITFGDLYEMIGDADTAYKAREYNPDGGVAESWIPLLNSPQHGYGNPAHQEYFTYATGFIRGANAGGTNFTTSATAFAFKGVKSFVWKVDLVAGQQLGICQLTLEKPKECYDAKGQTRKTQFTNVTLTSCPGDGTANNDAGTTGFGAAWRAYNPYWYMGEYGVVNTKAQPWTDGSIWASDDFGFPVITIVYNYDDFTGVQNHDNMTLMFEIRARLTV